MLKNLIIFLLTIPFVLIIIPLLIIIFPMMLSIRALVSKLSKFTGQDLGEIMLPISSNLALDDINTNPKCSVVIHMGIKGHLDIEKLKTRMMENVIEVCNEHREIKNVELKQYPYKWMGFLFWKCDEKFDISNHIKYYEEDVISQLPIEMEQVREIEHELLFTPFAEKRSPWDFTVVRNVKSDKEENDTVLIYRFHHSLGDGFSALKLFLELFDKEMSNILIDHNPKYFSKPSFFQNVLNCTKFLKMPYDLLENFVESYDINGWEISGSAKSQKWISTVSDSVSVDVIKNSTRALNSTVSAVIFSAITTALRKAMLKRYGKVPNHIHVRIPLPQDKHPDKLGNFLKLAIIKLPVGEQESLKRLRNIEKSLNNLKNSTVVPATYLLATVIGSMFHWIAKPMATNPYFSSMTAMISSFPGPKTQMKLCGHAVVDGYFAIGPLYGKIGVHLTTFTYNQQFKARLMVHQDFLDHECDVETIANDVLRELPFHESKLNKKRE